MTTATAALAERSCRLSDRMDRAMKLPKGATVAVADGETLLLFRNSGEHDIKLEALPTRPSWRQPQLRRAHQSSSANPGESRMEEDSFAAPPPPG
jgi:protein required for attachment to host cells